FAAAPMPVVETEGCSYNAGKGCKREAKYSGLEVLLLLVPSLIILIPSAMAVYELIRVIWSWGEPFPLSGTILETVGNLFSLINK
ncbi:MAG: hypothetical protein PHQ75_09660, partial [Thermoguttaceae bacterium]|nr:hypothetical protein [Thermoguttaceae bacterium]